MSFVTVYNEDYIWYKEVPEKAKPIRPERLYVDFGDEPIRVERSISKERQVLEDSQRNRMKTVYHVSYNEDKKEDTVVPEEGEDEFLVHFREIYSKPTKKQMPVPLTSRRIFGYMRKDNIYMPLTTYQEELGRRGYTLLENTRGKHGDHKA